MRNGVYVSDACYDLHSLHSTHCSEGTQYVESGLSVFVPNECFVDWQCKAAEDEYFNHLDNSRIGSGYGHGY